MPDDDIEQEEDGGRVGSMWHKAGGAEERRCRRGS